ncbi:TetR/AcrR family transcriptional regulator [Ferrimonas marina]|uniref:Transcriptional regulator, TetR family n=1 Tax=Ferrimonas marina TaxID=299255 RepID=A0A1M5R2X8_9GAMM|nr:TetR/AcrR family transcriptional regulator [Ferrimonas marina]SHH20692.1 transcriptional regulator, TetR family [Ferrimonas marina]
MNLKTQAAEQTRQKIIDTATEILGTEGYQALTVGKLSKQAEISKGALYHHFASLQEVHLAVLQHVIDTYCSSLHFEGCQSLEEFFARSGEMLFHRLENNPVQIRAMHTFINQSMYEPEAQAPLLAMWEDNLCKYWDIATAVAPEVSKEDMDQAFMMLDTYFIGLVNQWFLIQDPDATKKNWQNFSCMLLHALRKNSDKA